MKILCVLGKHNYGNPARGEGYEYVNFLPALRNLGHQVVFFESFARDAYQDFADLNRQLLEVVESEKPDVILCVLLGYEVWLETLQMIRAGSNAILINWSTDDSWKYEQFSRFIAPAFHIYATTYASAMAKAQRDGYTNFVLTQWAANSARCAPPQPAAQCRYQVTFIGTAYGIRPHWMSQLAERGIEVECFGYGWHKGPVAAEQIPQIIRDSLVSLNFADAPSGLAGVTARGGRQIKARVFEVPGAGGLLLTERAEHLEEFYHLGDEVEQFGDAAELADKIGYLLAHPAARDRIAQAGYARTIGEHTYEARFAKLLALAQQLQGEQRERAIDFAEFACIEKQHAAGRILRVLKHVLQLPCVMVWGKARGPRAARRILFELSWRLVGRHTYSVSGWPGRLFYRES